MCVKEKNGKINLITDGDVRRYSNNLYKKKILDICNKKPAWIFDTDSALSALGKMNNMRITSLLVAKKQNANAKIKKLIGVIHLHHCLRWGIK